jgi:hypothetical protein
MPVFDTADKLVNPDHFAEKLVGAMCEITFTLKHYAIAAQTKANGKVVEANDVFSAHVESVVILKNAPPLPRSPYKGKLTKIPHHRPQQEANKSKPQLHSCLTLISFQNQPPQPLNPHSPSSPTQFILM